MVFKKALFFGGAVLLLAACDRATAPNALAFEGADAAARTGVKVTVTTPKGKKVGVNGLDGNCISVFVTSGLSGDSLQVCLPQ